MSATEPDIIKGLVIGVINKRSKPDTALKLMNVKSFRLLLIFVTVVFRWNLVLPSTEM